MCRHSQLPAGFVLGCVLGQQRLREVVTLHHVAVELATHVDLPLLVHAHHDHLAAQAMREAHELLEVLGVTVDEEGIHELLVDLDDRRGDGHDVGKRRIAHAKVVQRDGDAGHQTGA